MPMLDISGRTALYLIPGDPVTNVRLPRMFNAVFARHGIDAVMAPVQVSARDFATYLVLGAGVSGAAIGVALAEGGTVDGVETLAFHDLTPGKAEGVAARLDEYFDGTVLALGAPDPEGFDLVINATPLGVEAHDPLPVADRAPGTACGRLRHPAAGAAGATAEGPGRARRGRVCTGSFLMARAYRNRAGRGRGAEAQEAATIP